jgi:hypothetical protein
MFSLQLAEKKERESQHRKQEESREQHWLKKYHS